MATRDLTTINNTTGGALPTFSTTVDLEASDETSVIDVARFSKAKIYSVTSAFGTGDITVTAQDSPDNTNFATLDTAETVTANGTVLVGGATQPLDISASRFLKVGRGGDANVGTVKIIIALA